MCVLKPGSSNAAEAGGAKSRGRRWQEPLAQPRGKPSVWRKIHISTENVQLFQEKGKKVKVQDCGTPGRLRPALETTLHIQAQSLEDSNSGCPAALP